MANYSLEDGRNLVRAARNAIQLSLSSPAFRSLMVERTIEQYSEKDGVFVTIKHYPTMTLRGRMGFTNPAGPLKRYLVQAAISAATEDPHFNPMSSNEIDDFIIEVSILSAPELLKGRSSAARIRNIMPGRDGLMIKYGFQSGTLLPSSSSEERWSKSRLLEELCTKAGLPSDYWKRGDVELYRFTVQSFSESEPEGEVKEVLFDQK